MSKQDVLKSAAKQAVISSQVDSVEIKLLGDVGLVMARVSFMVDDHGKQVIGHTGYLDVYQRRNGRWVAVAAHVTSLP
jgi:hypothetical protein